jgi:hypothetical protein
MPLRIEIFNQYYFSFLKKIKDIAREIKHSSTTKDPEAPYYKVLKAIKTHYASYDSLSETYIERFTQNEGLLVARESWNISVHEYKDIDDWIQSESIQLVEFYENISLKDMYSLVDIKDLLFYNVAILFLFSQDIQDSHIQPIVDYIKNIKNKDSSLCEKALENIDDENICKKLKILQETHNVAMTASVETSFKQLEETSLGKLAKEIMSDINLDDIQSSLANDNDIFKSLGNPDGGLTKLLSSVSQKMISKLASGEIKQETLLQDAMSFSSQLNNIIPNANGGGNDSTGGLGSMFEQLQKMTGGAGGLGNLQEMMSALGGMQGGVATNNGRKTQTRTDSSAMARTIKAKQLRNKLEKRKQQMKSSKENVETHIEENE